jgi:hypothetical protein
LAFLDVRIVQNIRTCYKITFVGILRARSTKFDILAVVSIRTAVAWDAAHCGSNVDTSVSHELNMASHHRRHDSSGAVQIWKKILAAIHYWIFVRPWMPRRYLSLKKSSYILYEFPTLFLALKYHEVMVSDKNAEESI